MCERACACVYPITVGTDRSGAISAVLVVTNLRLLCTYLYRYHTVVGLSFDVVAYMVHAVVAVLQSLLSVTTLRPQLLCARVCF